MAVKALMKTPRWAVGLILLASGRLLFSDPVSLSLPDLPWSLDIEAPGFVIEDKEIAPDGNAARLQAINKTSGVVLSAYLEKAGGAGDAKACRDYYWSRAKQSPFKKEQVSMRETGSLALVDYVVPEHLGEKLNQRNVNAYLAEGGFWMDVHLSRTGYTAGKGDSLEPVLQAIRINRAYVPTAQDRFAFGNIFYLQKNYKAAARHYEAGVELEKVKPSLPQTTWIVLVDQLGMSYGISGDAAKAKPLYEWALTREPEYPMFYYNLACAFAETGNPEKALENLKLAYQHKQHGLKGESIPNPRTDSSFTNYLANPQFKASLDALK
jgi:tetratricopeptide (TPR) repeat protein